MILLKDELAAYINEGITKATKNAQVSLLN